MVHFILRMAFFDFAFIGIHIAHTFNGKFEEAISALAFAWICDPIAKYAAPYVCAGWDYIMRKITNEKL